MSRRDLSGHSQPAESALGATIGKVLRRRLAPLMRTARVGPRNRLRRAEAAHMAEPHRRFPDSAPALVVAGPAHEPGGGRPEREDILSTFAVASGAEMGPP